MPRKHPAELVLQAVEQGRLSVEQLVRAALRSGPDFQHWVDAQAPQWARPRPSRQPRLRQPRPVPHEVALQALRRARLRWASLPEVLSVHWGLRRRQGLSLPQGGLVVLVTRKLPRERVPARHLLPAYLDVRRRGRAYRVPVDVQAVARSGLLHASRALHPGSHATVQVGSQSGTLGAIVRASDGSLKAVLSGHVAQRQGLQARALAVDGQRLSLGRVQRVLLGPEGDAACAGPLEPSCLEALASPSTSVRTLDTTDVSIALWVKVSRDISPRKTFVSDIGVTMPVRYQGGTRRLSGLIATTHDVTEAGDSGAPALDWRGHLVGFVVGSLGNKTYLMPAGRALEYLSD